MWQPGGSFSTTFITTQLIMAAKELKKKILEYAVQPTPAYNTSHFFKTAQPPAFPGKKPEDLDIKDSIVFEKANPANRKDGSRGGGYFLGCRPGNYASGRRQSDQLDRGWETGPHLVCDGKTGTLHRG